MFFFFILFCSLCAPKIVFWQISFGRLLAWCRRGHATEIEFLERAPAFINWRCIIFQESFSCLFSYVVQSKPCLKSSENRTGPPKPGHSLPIVATALRRHSSFQVVLLKRGSDAILQRVALFLLYKTGTNNCKKKGKRNRIGKNCDWLRLAVSSSPSASIAIPRHCLQRAVSWTYKWHQMLQKQTKTANQLIRTGCFHTEKRLPTYRWYPLPSFQSFQGIFNVKKAMSPNGTRLGFQAAFSKRLELKSPRVELGAVPENAAGADLLPRGAGHGW